MRRWVNAWLANRRARKAERERVGLAIDRALDYFKRSRNVDPMHGIALAITPDWIVVRVLFMENHIPPSRAWYRVQLGSIVELSFEDVKHIDTAPWR